MMYDYVGVVEEVGQTQSIGVNGFTKREIIVGNDIESENRYPNPVKFSFKRGNTTLLDGIVPGQRVKIRFAIDGRRWDGGSRGVQYFVDLTGVKVEVLNADGTSTEPVAVPPPATMGAIPSAGAYPSAGAASAAGAVPPPPRTMAQPISPDLDDVPF